MEYLDKFAKWGMAYMAIAYGLDMALGMPVLTLGIPCVLPMVVAGVYYGLMPLLNDLAGE